LAGFWQVIAAFAQRAFGAALGKRLNLQNDMSRFQRARISPRLVGRRRRPRTGAADLPPAGRALSRG
jgi:hypothetical protein